MKQIITPCAVALILFTSCMSSHDVVNDGIFQQRKYVDRGWFIDIPSAKSDHRNTEVPQIAEVKDAEAIHPESGSTAPAMPVQDLIVEEPIEVAEEDVLVMDDIKTAEPSLEEDASWAAVSPMTGWVASYTAKANERPQYEVHGEVAEQEAGGINIFALLGFIFAFLVPIAGLVLSIIGLNQTTKGGGDGYGLALAGLIISIVFIAVWTGVIIGPR